MPAAAVRLHSAGADAAPIELAATFYLPDKGSPPFPGLIVAHGAGSRQQRHEPFCREASGLGFAVLSLDFRGHGGSEGIADGPLEDDLIAATGLLRRHPAVDGARLGYRGSSMGGFYGLKAAAAGWFAAVALLCPAGEETMLTGLDDFEARDTEAPAGEPQPAATRWDIPRMRDYFLRQHSLALAARVSCPVLLVHARGDAVVPLSHSLALAGNLKGDATLLALAGGSHTTPQHDPAIHRFTARWLLDQLGSTPPVTSACTGRT
jgi:uncharacterized protein